MNTVVIVLIILALFLFIVAYKKDDGSHSKGINQAYKNLVNMMPLLILAFIIAGFLQVVVPPELIQSWLGEEAGLKGVIIGSLGGVLLPGGPYIAFPVIAAIYKSGAGLGTVIAFVVSWAMLSLYQVVFELAILGPRFTMLRLGLVLILPPLSGMIAYLLF